MPTERDALIETPTTLAIVVSSHEPLLLLSADQRIIAASGSFCRAFGLDPATTVGCPLARLGQGEWALPGLASLLAATASGHAQIAAYDVDLARPGQPTRKLIVNARTLDDGRTDHVRLLLALADVTEAQTAVRLRDDLNRENALLAREIQHRVANSLQIIASVLMLSARRVQSEEVRGHLTNAHHRVMSIATAQKLLSDSQVGQVPLRPYLVQLCASLGASMIADDDAIRLDVDCDNSVVEATVSVSLGLIVTELVINALKHAFPDQQNGAIHVAYAATADGWTLSVADDGVGLPRGPALPRVGLGTSILQALSRNLGAVIAFGDTPKGTTVTVTHHG